MLFKSRLGILGGGQLSMMLVQKAQALGLDPVVLTPLNSDPATRVTSRFILGDPRNPEDLKKFTKNLDFLTFESEFYDAAYLKKELKDFTGKIFPSLDCLEILQDRKTQKQAFLKYNLATSPFICTSDKKLVLEFAETNKKYSALVAKKRWNGYDGYGTFILKTKFELEAFLNQQGQELDHFIFEKMIKFKYEMAIQASRSRSGHTVFFPFVKTLQKDNKCFIVEGPEKTPGQLQKQLKKFLDKIEYVGTIGFEFFKTSKGLILNEVAPRVHNTGHHTLDSTQVDQFTLHTLCALVDKLPEPTLKTQSFVMLNLIGASGPKSQPQPQLEPHCPDQLGGNLYWYGKTNRPGRKLGHINYVGKNRKALHKRALTDLKKWKL